MNRPESAKSAPIYYESDVLRKEGVNTWVPYWAVIRGKWLQFYQKYPDSDRKDLRKTLEITEETKCSLVKRKKRRFPFSINNGKGIYYLKCETELERYHWIISMLTASIGKPKTDLPKSIPESMIENKAFYKNAYKEKVESNIPESSQSPKPPKNVNDFHTKRRKKYAARNETRMKRKEAKRARKLGLTTPSDSSSIDDSPVKQYYNKEQIQNDLHRTKDINSLSVSELRKTKSMEVLSENRFVSNQKNIQDNNSARFQRKNGSLHVKALVHSPTKQPIDNVAYEDDEDIEVFPTIPVILNEQHLLPNMIVSEITDSSDSEDDDTTDTSLNSQCSRFLSLSSTDISGKVLTTQTIISSESDHFEQRTLDGKLISTPTGRRKNLTRPVSAALKTNFLTPDLPPGAVVSLLDRPVTPIKQNPLRPNSPANFSRFFAEASNA